MSEWPAPDNLYRRKRYSDELITLSGQTLYNVCNEMVLRTHSILKKTGYLSPEEHAAAIAEAVKAERERIQRALRLKMALGADTYGSYYIKYEDWHEFWQELE